MARGSIIGKWDQVNDTRISEFQFPGRKDEALEDTKMKVCDVIEGHKAGFPRDEVFPRD